MSCACCFQNRTFIIEDVQSESQTKLCEQGKDQSEQTEGEIGALTSEEAIEVLVVVDTMHPKSSTPTIALGSNACAATSFATTFFFGSVHDTGP